MCDTFIYLFKKQAGEMVWCRHRRRNDFQSEGAKFWKSKMARKRRPSRLRDAGGVSEGGCAPLRSRSFFENVVLNETI